jgi:hypothetical protein
MVSRKGSGRSSSKGSKRKKVSSKKGPSKKVNRVADTFPPPPRKKPGPSKK